MIQHIMAGAPTESSRMGITLQGYDQVIALSQANINESLRRHFASLDAKDELAKFKAEVDTSSINAEVLAPTVELFDIDGADRAHYIIHLGKGTYSTATKVDKKLQLVDMPTDGWELAFDIDFAFKPVIKIPDHIARQVPLPGGYSVQQLIINFGDITRVVQLDMKRSKYQIPDNLQGRVNPVGIESGLELFARTYLKDKLQHEQGHNILGYAVKADQVPSDRSPEFIPTDSKVQIIGHRSNGRAESFRQDNPYNAFCFTEMTRKRTMPSHEIKYSGNWFYESIGGTLAMSRSLFWDAFMVEKVKVSHAKAVELSASILHNIAGKVFKCKPWCIDDSEPTRPEMCGSYKGSASWGNLAYATTYKSSELQHWDKHSSPLVSFWYCPRSTVHTLAKPSTRKGEIVVQQDVELSWELGAEIASDLTNIPVFAIASKAFKPTISGSLKLTLTTTLSFRAVPSTGDLQVDSETKTKRNDYEGLDFRISPLDEIFPEDLRKMIKEWPEKVDDNYKNAKQSVAGEVKKLVDLFSEVGKGLRNDLNNQNKFIFPGNGTFDMKDPIFSDNGDLMVGLTYR